jgi:hypothetical protein
MLSHSARSFEVRFDVNEGKAIPVIQNQLGVINAKLFGDLFTENESRVGRSHQTLRR